MSRIPHCATLARALRGEFLPRIEAESRFDRILDELRQDREEQRRKWDEHNSRWDEQNRKWDANQLELKRLHEEVMTVSTKIDRTIGGLGARWGMQSERASVTPWPASWKKNSGSRYAMSRNTTHQERFSGGRTRWSLT